MMQLYGVASYPEEEVRCANHWDNKYVKIRKDVVIEIGYPVGDHVGILWVAM